MPIGPDFSLSDLMGPETIEQYAGDSAEAILGAIIVYDVTLSDGTLSMSLAVDADSTSTPIPVLGDLVTLDLSQATAVSDPTVDWVQIGTIQGSLDPLQLEVSVSSVGLAFSSELVVPADGSDHFTAQFNPAFGASLDTSGIHISSGAIQIPTLDDSVSPWFELGQTGLQFAGDAGVNRGGEVVPALWGENSALQPLGIDSSFRGVVAQGLKFRLPADLTADGDPVTVKVPSARIAANGFSCDMAIDDFGSAQYELFGVTIVPDSFALSVRASAIASCALEATLTLPFFDKDVDVLLSIAGGAWTLSLKSDFVDLDLGPIQLTLTGLGIEHVDGDTWFRISGSLAITGVTDFADLPTLDLKDVLIDRHGKIKASGGMASLQSQKTLKFGEILTARLAKFGFGQNTDCSKVVVLSGEISLIESLSLSGKFSNLKITWSDANSATLSVDDVEIGVSVAGVFQFKGDLQLKPGSDPGTHVFAGGVNLGLTAPQLGIDGSLAVAEVKEKDSGHTDTAFALALDLTIPTGIPLGQSGIGIFEIDGLLAWRYGPKFADPTDPNKWINWFLADPVGTSDVATKWQPSLPDKGLGGGLGFGTIVDASFSWHAKTALIILLPGPVLILSGSADFVSLPPGLLTKTTGAMQAMVTYDGNVQTISAAISAQLGKDPVLSAGGAAAAFFDLVNPSDWYLNIGTLAKPISANVCHIATGQAFLDLGIQQSGAFAGQTGLAFGLQAAINESFSIPVVGGVTAIIQLDAWPPTGGVDVDTRPLRADGGATLTGTLGATLLGIGLKVAVSAGLEIELVVSASDPVCLAYYIHASLAATFTVDISIHAWFVNVDIHESIAATIDLAFRGQVPSSGTPELTADGPDPPVRPLKSISLEHAHTTDVWQIPFTSTAPSDADVLPETGDTEQTIDLYIVPIDALPTLTFAVPIGDGGAPPFGANAPQATGVQIGDAEYEYVLDAITISSASGQVYPSSATSAFKAGYWNEGLGTVGKTRLQLWADNPGFMYQRAGATSTAADAAAITGPCPCDVDVPTPQLTCESLCPVTPTMTAGNVRYAPANCTCGTLTFALGGWRLVGTLGTACYLQLEGSEQIKFPAPVSEIVLHFVTLTNELAANVQASWFTACDAHGHPLPATRTLSVDAASGTSQVTITVNAGVCTVVKMALKLRCALSEVCYLTAAQAAAAAQAASAAQQLAQSLQGAAADTTPRPVFEPWTEYTIKVSSHCTGPGGQIDFVDTAVFYTGGPPGLPDTANQEQAWKAAGKIELSESTRYPNGGPLVDLTPYVAATVPIADRQRVQEQSFDNAYRGYDPTVTFNEGYVEAMYPAAPTLNVAELNGGMLLDSEGNFAGADGTEITNATGAPVAGASQFNPAGVDGALGRYGQLWQSQLECCDISLSPPVNQQVSIPYDPRAALGPRRGYELQLSGGGTSPVFRTRFITSRFLTMTHHLQSHPGLVFTESCDPLQQTLDALLAQTTTFEQALATLGLGAIRLRETLDVTALTDTSGQARALLCSSPESLPADRIAITTSAVAGAGGSATAAAAAAMKIIGVADRSYIDLMLLDAGDPAGIEVWTETRVRGPRPGPIRRAVLYTFPSLGTWPSGTVFHLYAGSTPPPAPQDWQPIQIAYLPSGMAKITLTRAGAILHQLPVLSGLPAVTTSAVWSQDARRFLLIPVQGTASTTFPAAALVQVGLTLARGIGDPSSLRQWTRCGDGTAETSELILALP